MKTVYGYIRVSTLEQGKTASLPEQKSAIQEYAKKNDLKIVHWYEEKKTAAKIGRPFFAEMMENLKEGKAKGVIMHKIDRSARNLHDWAAVGDLTDNGIEVHFAHESLDMTERGGRLSADIQAVMASDYVRNLRQETIKGLYGRLKQGIFPWQAPVGYLDNGKGKLKTIDPIKGPLIKELFNLYISESYNILELSKVMETKGLTNIKGKRVCKNGISRILNNPFYTGIIKIKGEVYQGKHEALISTRTFKLAQAYIKRRRKSTGQIHYHIYRKLIKCFKCKYFLRGEKQKGIVYYRCHTKNCNSKSKRQDYIESNIKNVLRSITLSKQEYLDFKSVILKGRQDLDSNLIEQMKAAELRYGQLKSKESALLEAYLENVISKEDYMAEKKKVIVALREQQEIKEGLAMNKALIFDQLEKMVELCKSPLKIYDLAILDEKRELVKILGSNLALDVRNLMFSLKSPFLELANRSQFSFSALERDEDRTVYTKYIYSDINTSAIVPEPLNKEEIKGFFEYLLQNPDTLQDLYLKDQYEI